MITISIVRDSIRVTTHSADPETPSAELLDRYLAGECLPEEIARVERWLARFEDSPRALRALQEMQRSATQSRWDLETNWSGLAQRVQADEAQDGTATNETPSRNRTQSGARANTGGHRWMEHLHRRTSWVTIAGALGAALCIALGWHSRERLIRSELSGHGSVYTTANGERATVTLPDGSAVTLNVGSRLTVGSDYATGHRVVRLQGEAIFEVLSKAESPFTVIAGPSITKVLGTRFLVRHYATDTSATVAVQRGRVVVGTQVVAAHQEVNVSPNAHTVIRRATETRFGFSHGVLAFDGAPLGDAIADLNRWYDADVRLGDPELRSRRLAGEYVPGTVSDLAEMLRWTFGVTVVREGRVLTLYPN